MSILDPFFRPDIDFRPPFFGALDFRVSGSQGAYLPPSLKEYPPHVSPPPPPPPTCPALPLAAIVGKNKACSGGRGGTILQNKPWQSASVAWVGCCGCKCDDGFFDNSQALCSYHESGNMNQYANSSYLRFYVSLCKCNCRRRSTHCTSATQFAPQKCVSLITEKFPKEEGGQ